MQAIVYTAPLTLELQDVPEPITAAGEVIVEVRAAGICGSELEGFKSQSPFRVPPLIMGHELAGIRLDTGAAVAINPLISCRVCDLCLRGQENLCRTRALVGIHRAGGFAERVAVPERCLHEIGAMPFELAALAEPLANAVHALRLAQEHDPQPARVGVIGAGALGLACALVAKRIGAAEVVICDLSEERLEAAARAGITTSQDGLHGEFDVIVDAVGSAATRRMAAERLRPGGTAVWLGLHAAEAGVDGLDLTRRELRVLGTFAYADRDFRAALELLPALEVDWTTTAPLRDGIDVFMELIAGPGAATKTLLVG
ncbi:alcohol dehydrogenase catalytic domain-containing protein [Conexibacter stalactiti]|uniref:Alcohol dehydrogenase catalytic domain-containing protein n=1 Tax=Conexibacter stalactiti TaxID=1940611 RepID=A0ABU4HKR9_9ACTN|nr:alcohol dehydrogenase catalytic domain-containing protein [Conexibacter stalactiti]MDW5593893.1 alcohol dehydrogenase catalytic domain-containing protein [Conexibacter stalactiti]MEC5034535.1 alcohol dehydrogenase catalytic domain-containing protein [Conexibacter stalactiti]